MVIIIILILKLLWLPSLFFSFYHFVIICLVVSTLCFLLKLRSEFQSNLSVHRFSGLGVMLAVTSLTLIFTMTKYLLMKILIDLLIYFKQIAPNASIAISKISLYTLWIRLVTMNTLYLCDFHLFYLKNLKMIAPIVGTFYSILIWQISMNYFNENVGQWSRASVDYVYDWFS